MSKYQYSFRIHHLLCTVYIVGLLHLSISFWIIAKLCEWDWTIRVVAQCFADFYHVSSVVPQWVKSLLACHHFNGNTILLLCRDFCAFQPCPIMILCAVHRSLEGYVKTKQHMMHTTPLIHLQTWHQLSVTYIECECEHDEDEEHLQDVPHLFPPLCILTSSSAPFPTWIQTQSVASRLRQCLSLLLRALCCSPLDWAHKLPQVTQRRTLQISSYAWKLGRFFPITGKPILLYFKPIVSAAQTNRNLFQLFLSDFNVLSGRRVQFWLDKTIE